MSRKKRYIGDLTAEEKAELEAGMKAQKGYQFQRRCHAILLSNQGYTVSEIALIFKVSKCTVYAWFGKGELVA